jgi:hypothetical protein
MLTSNSCNVSSVSPNVDSSVFQHKFRDSSFLSIIEFHDAKCARIRHHRLDEQRSEVPSGKSKERRRVITWALTALPVTTSTSPEQHFTRDSDSLAI